MRRSVAGGASTVDVLFCVADHYEPDHGGAPADVQRRRVERWLSKYPAVAEQFVDADGVHPQHTFFSPLEVYDAQQMDLLADLCRRGFGEVEVHLHHGHDNSDNVRKQLVWFRDLLSARHGLLGRQSGQPKYGFIHGNWALDNGRENPQFCGVNDELRILHETGCYADFTMPAAPDPAQSRTVNAIYYAIDDPLRARSYDRGVSVRVGGSSPPGALPLISGPLMLRWDQRSRGILPRVDNAALDSSRLHHPSIERFRLWVKAAIAVEGRPEWIFVKVHTHGAKDANADVLLGAPMADFHRALGREFNDGSRFRLHYVTARELFNIMKAAEAGHSGNAGRFRDFLISRPDVMTTSRSVLESAAR
jgi:hypothetical protein